MAVLADKALLLTLAVCTLAVTVPYLNELPMWTVLGLGGMIAWRYLIDQHGWYTPGRYVRAALAVVAAAVTLRHYGTVFGRDAGIAFLILLLGLKFLELRTIRDAILIVFLLYLLILGNFLFSSSLGLALYLLLLVAVCTAALIQLNLPGSRLRFRLQLAARLVLWALPLTVIIYLAFPRLSGALWGLPGGGRGALTGMSDELTMGAFSGVAESDAIAFRAQFKGSPPSRRDLYWRGVVLWEFDGRRWSREPTEPPVAPLTHLHERANPYSYRVLLEPTGRPWMFALDMPADVSRRALIRHGLVLERRRPVFDRLRYDVVSYTRYRADPADAWERHSALQLPSMSARVQALVRRWRGAGADPQDIVRAALAYFRREPFYYTLEPPALGDDPVDEFLFETRRGFCEHFAGSFAALMRAAGLPARVVLGYQGGELNPSGDYLVVRQQDAHAWAEVLLPGKGWVRIDPTAAVAPERIQLGSDAVRRLQRQGLQLGEIDPQAMSLALRLGWLESVRRYGFNLWDAVNMAWYEWVTDFDAAKQRRLWEALSFGAPAWLVPAVGGMAVAVILAALAAGLRRIMRMHRDPVQQAYRRFRAKLATRGLAPIASEGPLQLAARVGARRPEWRSAATDIIDSYIALRYGRAAGAQTLKRLRGLVRAFPNKTSG